MNGWIDGCMDTCRGNDTIYISFLLAPLFPLLAHSILYSLLVPFLIYSFPDSFTLCEVSLISQGVSLLITDCTLVVATKVSVLLVLYDTLSLSLSLSLSLDAMVYFRLFTYTRQE